MFVEIVNIKLEVLKNRRKTICHLIKSSSQVGKYLNGNDSFEQIYIKKKLKFVLFRTSYE